MTFPEGALEVRLDAYQATGDVDLLRNADVLAELLEGILVFAPAIGLWEEVASCHPEARRGCERFVV